MLHYVNLKVSDLERSGAFYDAVLAPLGWRRQEDLAGSISWGMNKPALFITLESPQQPGFGPSPAARPPRAAAPTRRACAIPTATRSRSSRHPGSHHLDE